MNRAPLLVLVLLMLSGCTSLTISTSDDEDRVIFDVTRNYDDETFPVRLIDRNKFPTRFRPSIVNSPYIYPVGTLVVDTGRKFIYLIEDDLKARRYGIAVGAAGYAWSGTATLARKAKWPAWHPTDGMRNQSPDLPIRVDPGPHNPLGARALYLFSGGIDTLYRVHGTSEPWTIGTNASSGCIRMFNEDVIDLFERVKTGSRVIVL